jgi:positive regulator of sigma E activity
MNNEKITLFDIQREVAVNARKTALLRQSYIMFFYIMICCFDGRFSFHFEISTNLFALIGSFLIFIGVFDATYSYFQGFRKKKKQQEILERRIMSIDGAINVLKKHKLLQDENYVLTLEARTENLKEVLNEIKRQI